MNETSTNTTTMPLEVNEHVAELLAILKENSRNADDLYDVLGYVDKLESQLVTLSGELSVIRDELAAVRDVQDHPAKHALESAAERMENTISTLHEKLSEIKANIIEGCKNAVTAFKENGITALSNLASFFHIGDGLQSIKKNLEGNIRSCDKTIAMVESISDAYHEAGRRLKNVGRALTDKEPFAEASPSGKVAKFFEAPARREKASYEVALGDVNKAIAGLERLEATAEKIQDSRAEKKSVKSQIKQHQQKTAQEKKEAPAVEKPKAKEASL